MNIEIDKSWKVHLEKELDQEYFKDLMSFLEKEYHEKTCYPPKQDIFAAFDCCKFNNLKVVIIGQDPYHGLNQANGLCFSVYNGIKHPPSLVNIFKELNTDLGLDYPKNGDLSAWAKQGVLLLNATLTVEAHKAGSHQKKGWEIFTDELINMISQKKENIIFLLWGGFAKKKGKKIDAKKHFVLTSGHPSPLSANRGFWFGNNHFSKSNDILIKNGETPIDWLID